MSIKKVKGNIFPKKSGEPKGKQSKNSEVQIKPQLLEHMSSEESLSSKAYAMAQINFKGKPAIGKTTLVILMKSMHYSMGGINNVLKSLKDNIDLAQTMVISSRFHEDWTPYILDLVNDENHELAETMINDTELRGQHVAEILQKTNKNNMTLAEMLVINADFQGDEIVEILDAAKKTSVGIAKIMVSNPDFEGDEIIEILDATNKDNIDIAKYIFSNPDFPKNEIANILNATNKHNKALAQELLSDSKCPKEIIKNILRRTSENNINSKFGAYNYIKAREKEFKNDYKELVCALEFVNNKNIQIFKKMVEEENLPKKEIKNILEVTKGDNIELLEMLLDDTDFPRNSIKSFLDVTRKANIKQMKELYLKNRNEIIKLKKDGYEIKPQELQNTSDIDIVAEKTKPGEKEGLLEQIRYITRLNKNGIVSKSRCEVYDIGNNKIVERTSTSDGKYSCDSYYIKVGQNKKILTKELRFVNGATRPIYVQKIIVSPLMKGAYDVTIYDLEDIDESINVPDQVIRGELKGQDIARTFKNPDGTIIHIEEFQSGEYHTKRKISANDDETKTSLEYTITNLKGKKILDIQRTFELMGNTSITTLHGRKYKVEFDDDKMTAKITNEHNEERIIDFKEKTRRSTLQNRTKLWSLIKKAPADVIFHFSDINQLEYEKGNGHWSYRAGRITTDTDLGIISHELGHYLDTTNGGEKPIANTEDIFRNNEISTNPKLIKIYNKEMENFKKNISEIEQENLKYFSQISSSPVLGLGELVAEVNMLCTTHTNLNLQTRALYLTKHFPKTMAMAAKLLGYGGADDEN